MFWCWSYVTKQKSGVSTEGVSGAYLKMNEMLQ